MNRLLRARCASLLGLACLAPIGTLAAGTGPSEPCVPGTVWEDLASGVKYICVYDEVYGGSRWELLSTGQTGDEDWLSRSTTYGCTARRWSVHSAMVFSGSTCTALRRPASSTTSRV